MTTQRLIIDSDAFVLLAGADLLDRALEVLGVAVGDARRLDALPHMLRRPRPFRSRYGDTVADRALAACGRVAGLQMRGDEALIDQLAAVDAIDGGEAQIYAIAASDQAWLVASGDKRAMRALCEAPSLAPVRATLCGRVTCIESILRRIVADDGLDTVRAALVSVRSTSKVLEVAFSDGNLRSATDCSVALVTYEEELVVQLGDGFLRRM